jgi:hypothetical protein
MSVPANSAQFLPVVVPDFPEDIPRVHNVSQAVLQFKSLHHVAYMCLCFVGSCIQKMKPALREDEADVTTFTEYCVMVSAMIASSMQWCHPPLLPPYIVDVSTTSLYISVLRQQLGGNTLSHR